MSAALVVLDGHALVAYFRNEPGANQVVSLLKKAATTERPLHMTEVNYAETKFIIVRKDGPAAWEASARVLTGLPIEFHTVDRLLADSAADFKARFKMSLADAFAAALAREMNAELVTGDQEFKALAKEIKICWLKA